MRPVRKTIKEEKIRKPGVCRQGFIVEDKIYPLYSGSFHYWRHPRELWGPILDNITGMGFRTICTYVPWCVHEQERGRFDYRGNRDLGSFLSLCAEKGFRVLLRPGPHINSEFSYFGYPERILFDEEIMALTSLGTPSILAIGARQFPIPSYASEKFYQEAAVYFDSLIPVIKEYVYPEGPVIGMQSDNETSYFFRARAPYELDYHPDSIRLYQRMLQELYGDIDTLNQHYHGSYRDFSGIQPPRDFQAKKKQEMPYYLDWGKYKEYQLKFALERIAEMFREREIKELPIYHNYPFAWEFPFDIPGTEELPEIAAAGLDHYAGKEKYSILRSKARFLSGSSRLPFIPEFVSGLWLSLYDAFPPEEEEFLSLAALMHGVKAINFYMIVERERWTGSPITRENRIRDGYFEMYRRLNQFLSASKFHQFKKRVDVLVLQNYDLERVLHVSRRWLPSALMAPEELQIVRKNFNFVDECLAARKWYNSVLASLEEGGIDFDLANSRVSARKLRDYKYVFLPTASFISEEVLENLKDYAARGGRLVIGPKASHLNYYLSRGKQLKEGEGIALLEEPELEGFIAGMELRSEFTVDNREVDITVFGKEERRIVFAANSASTGKDIKVSFPGAKTFQDLLTGEKIEGISDIQITLSPWQVRVLEAESSA